MPSRTLPSHTSMLTGVGPARHGIIWNSDRTAVHGTVEVPTIFGRANDAGFETAAFFSKSKLQHLQVPNTLDYTEAPAGSEKRSAGQTVRQVRRYLEDERPNLLFVHLGEPDYAGHRYSWMSWFYGRAVREADRAVADLLDAADKAFGEGEYAVIITADHGGHGWSHGSADPRDVTIPWIAWGEGIRQGVIVDDDVHTVDTTATALSLLGLAPLGAGEAVTAALAPVPPSPPGSLLAGPAAFR